MPSDMLLIARPPEEVEMHINYCLSGVDSAQKLTLVVGLACLPDGDVF